MTAGPRISEFGCRCHQLKAAAFMIALRQDETFRLALEVFVLFFAFIVEGEIKVGIGGSH